MSISIHPSAIVDNNVKIGQGTKVWHWTHISSGASIGEYCTLGQNVYIAPNVRIGNHVKIQNNVSIYSGINIQDNVFIGPSAVFTNVINPRANIERKHEFKTTTIEEGASIGANATIICGNTIGAYSLIGAGAVVTKSIPAHALVQGTPARQQGWVSKAGLKLAFKNNRALCPETGERYILNEGILTPAN